MSQMIVDILGRTDVGLVRKGNEDNYAITQSTIDPNWTEPDDSFCVDSDGFAFVVADGMGGAEAGEVASELSISAIKNYLINEMKATYGAKEISHTLESSLLYANEKIKDHVKANPSTMGMGTTATVCYIKDHILYIAWIGDSRVYRYSKTNRVSSHNFYSGDTEILTNDHSLVWQEVLRGSMTPEEARVAQNSNIITQSLGDMYRIPTPEVKMFELFQDDIILSCSDGLNGMISDAEINSILSSSDDLNRLCADLMIGAKQGGGTDNITIVLCKITEGNIFSDNDIGKTVDTTLEESKTVEVVNDVTKVEPIIEESKVALETNEYYKVENDISDYQDVNISNEPNGDISIDKEEYVSVEEVKTPIVNVIEDVTNSKVVDYPDPIKNISPTESRSYKWQAALLTFLFIGAVLLSVGYFFFQEEIETYMSDDSKSKRDQKNSSAKIKNLSEDDSVEEFDIDGATLKDTIDQ